ncbi:HDOD domain-containing protein [Chitiniphilus purpureus]|uniref:HDOD domain-containing protein n=1 Tax=Chitiniphilus purpureus TaxID=2981137 RepID=A0ABY6DIX5_9NEIS|nr:HDOD domain-containing protein [Chitiniphilus sp. CD1]UXY14300.1 HDOD domain-containing protein [Chitiniphilus sp. CD1]
MATLTSDQAATWHSKALPMLQTSRERLLPLARRAERVQPQEVADIVQRDPLLVAQVLRAANQRSRSGLSADVIAIDNAVMLYGVAPFVERFARGPTVEELLAGDETRYRRYRSAVLEIRFAAGLAREFAHRRHDARPEEILAGALLHGIPALLGLLDPTHVVTPAMLPQLLGAWHIPEAVRTLCDEPREAGPRQVLHQAALHLAQDMQHGWWQPALQGRLQVIAQVLQQPIDAVWRVATTQALTCAGRDYAETAGFWPAARWLPMLPGDWPLPAAPASAPLRPDPLAQRLQALHLAGRQGVPANQIVSLVVRALAEGLTMRRIALILLTQDGRLLRTRFTHGAVQDDPLCRLELALDPPTLFSQLLQKPQCVWLRGDKRREWAALLPEHLTTQIGGADFCAMSLFVGDKPLGVLFADRSVEAPLVDGDYQSLRRICQLACTALADSTRRAS